MGLNIGHDIYGNKAEELILNIILTPFLCHSYGIKKWKVYIREQDIGAHSHSHSNAILMSFVWDTILGRVYMREQDILAFVME